MDMGTYHIISQRLPTQREASGNLTLLGTNGTIRTEIEDEYGAHHKLAPYWDDVLSNVFRAVLYIFAEGMTPYITVQARPADTAAESFALNTPEQSYLRYQFDELRKVEDGWLDGEGLAPQPEHLDWLAAFLAERYPADLPTPALFPTEEGGVAAEWSFGGAKMPNYQTPLYVASLEMDLQQKRGKWHSLNMQTKRDSAGKIDLTSAHDWQWILGKLYQYQQEAR